MSKSKTETIPDATPAPVIVTAVRYSHISHSGLIYYWFPCPCGRKLFIAANDDAEPVECPECGLTYDLEIRAVGTKPTA